MPLWIVEMRGHPVEQAQALAREDAATIAAHGDDLMFRTNKKCETARAFNALARGLAIASYTPGGVSFAGHHWCGTREQACIRPEVCSTHRGQAPPEPPPPVRATKPARRPVVDVQLPLFNWGRGGLMLAPASDLIQAPTAAPTPADKPTRRGQR